MVPIKIPKTTPSAEPITADRTVLVAQLFINSSCCIISGVGRSILRYVRSPGGNLFRSSRVFASISAFVGASGTDVLVAAIPSCCSSAIARFYMLTLYFLKF